MDHQFGTAQFFIEFFSDAAGLVPVTPTAGTIVSEMSPSGTTWFSSEAGDIAATDVVVGSASYDIPTFYGQALYGRVTLSGITGAAYFRAWFWRAE